ncbi:MAG: glycosyltransferase family 2 protein [Janthinobacterium lividum]
MLISFISVLILCLSGLIGAAAIPATLSLLVLLAAAAGSRRRPALSRSAAPLLLAVIVPAHNEELVLAGTLTSLKAQKYPKECFEIVVVADNCTDGTLQIAYSHNVTTLERVSSSERGKGYALNHAISYLLEQPLVADGFIVVDADTWVAPDFLACMSARISCSHDIRGYGAWQGRYGVLNGQEGWRAALMTAAFDLVNHVKPLGRDALGLSAGLKGNGMAFTRALAAALPWPGGSLTEDLDYGLELARCFGLRVEYAPEARVQAQMPVTASQAASQRKRWEGGRLGLMRERALPLLWEGLRCRSLLLIDAAWDLLIPPLAELGALLLAFAGLTALGTVMHSLPHPGFWISAGAFGVAGLIVYVLGGLRVAGAPPEAYAALLRAPLYAVWKFVLLFTRRKRSKDASGDSAPIEWVRTERTSLSADLPDPISERVLP